MKKNNFVSIIKKPAMEVMKTTGLLASVTMAQAALESGWFESELYKNANNPFGIKGEYNGKSYKIVTEEEKEDGTREKVSADFRKYPDLITAINDRTNVLYNSKNGKGEYRYRAAFNERDPETAITIIKEGGYATASNYVETIMNIINQNNFTQYDKEVINELEKEAKESPVTDNIVEVEAPKIQYYVRSSKDDKVNQKGAFAELTNAISLCDSLEGYYVFDANMNIIHESALNKKASPNTINTSSSAVKVAYVAGTKLNIKSSKLYVSSVSNTATRNISNMVLYIYDGKNFNGRYRVCINKSYCNTNTKNVYGYISIEETVLK